MEFSSFFMPFRAITPLSELKSSSTLSKLLPSADMVQLEWQPVAKKKATLYHAEVSSSMEKPRPAASQSAMMSSRLSTCSAGITLLS